VDRLIRCECAAPSRDPHTGDRERCIGCGGWTPHGRPAPRGGFDQTVAELRSLLDRLALDWGAIAADPTPARRGDGTGGSALAWSDPTGDAATATGRRYIGDWVVLTARFLDRARLELRRADDAIGRALYAADPGPAEKTAGPWYPTVDIAARPDLIEAHDAQTRRHARGES